MDRNELPFDPCNLGVPSGTTEMNSMHVTHSAQTVHLSNTEINTVFKQTKVTFHLTHQLGVLSGVPKMISEPMHDQREPCTYLVSRLALSQKRPKWHSIWPTSRRSFIVCPNRFPSLWYVSPNPCTYLTLRLTLSPNGPKWASTWPTSQRSSIGCAQNDFWAYCTFGANHGPILCGD
jgi:hypothetical protein